MIDFRTYKIIMDESLLLINFDIAVSGKQILQRQRRQVQQLAGLVRVEQTHDVNTEVALQPLHVVFGSM